MLSLIPEILSILAPSALLALLGYGWFRLGPEFPIPFVTTLVMNFAMPALLFHTLATSTVDIRALGDMALATLVVHVAFAVVAMIMLRSASKDWRLCIAHVVGNTGNLGLPVCFFAFGEQGLSYAMTFFAVQCLLLFSLGDTVLAGTWNVLKSLKSPILHAIWIGALVRMLQVPVPGFVLDTASLLGQVGIPLMLLTLGVSLAGMRATQLPSNLLWSAIRTVTAVTIGYLVATLFGFDGVARGVLIIETAVPVAVFNFLMAVRHGRDTAEISGMILVTHLAAIAYLPVLLAFLL